MGREGRHEGHALVVCPEGSADECLAKELRCPATERAPLSLHIVHCVVLASCSAQGDCIECLFSFTHMRTLAGSPLKLTFNDISWWHAPSWVGCLPATTACSAGSNAALLPARG